MSSTEISSPTGTSAEGPVAAASRETIPTPPPRADSSNRALAIILVLVLAGMLHYLAGRHPLRRDISRMQYYGLSEQSLSVLKTVTEPVEIILLFQSGQAGYADIYNLLREYAYHNPNLRLSRVDPDRQPARTREILERFPVTDANVVIFSAPERGGHRVIERQDLFRYDLSRVPEGGRPTVSAFRGEQAFTSALHDLFQARRPVVYFIEGHGQRPIDSFESRVGFGELALRIQQENVEVRALRIGETRAIPADCDVLVIAGPRRRLSQPEVDLIGEYLLRQGGRLLALLDAQTLTGLEPMLLRWGVRVGNEIAVDPTRTLTGRELFVGSFGAHPITHPLQGMTCIFTLPRTVEPVALDASPDRPSVTPLASTTPVGWGETDFSQRPLVMDPGVDRPGPISIAVAVEKGAPSAGLQVQIRPTRIVVIGESYFLANENIVAANADFFLNAMRWMLDRPEWMAIPPKSTAAFQLALTSDQVKAIGWIAILAIPALAAGLGLWMAWRRRK